MYEEDRQTALSMYDRMFDNAEDEQALLSFLGSPTRQAVVIARSYNAKSRKLSVEAQAGRGSADIAGSELPEFVEVINEIHEDAMNLNVVSPAVSRDQLSFFSDTKNDPDPFEVEPVEEPVTVAEAAPAEEPAPVEEPAPAEESAPAEEPAESAHDDKIDEFMDSFTLSEAPAAEKAVVPEQEKVHETEEPRTSFAVTPKDEEKSGPNVFLLILYLIVSVPLTAIGIIILLIPALLFLALSIAVVIIGSKAMAAAFGGFAVFSDVMVVLGASLVIMALGLILFWIFVWFIGGAIAGLINAVIRLGGKICYGEEN